MEDAAMVVVKIMAKLAVLIVPTIAVMMVAKLKSLAGVNLVVSALLVMVVIR